MRWLDSTAHARPQCRQGSPSHEVHTATHTALEWSASMLAILRDNGWSACGVRALESSSFHWIWSGSYEVCMNMDSDKESQLPENGSSVHHVAIAHQPASTLLQYNWLDNQDYFRIMQPVSLQCSLFNQETPQYSGYWMLLGTITFCWQWYWMPTSTTISLIICLLDFTGYQYCVMFTMYPQQSVGGNMLPTTNYMYIYPRHKSCKFNSSTGWSRSKTF